MLEVAPIIKIKILYKTELTCTGMCWIFQTAYMVLFNCFIQCNSNSDLNHMMFCVLICHYCCRGEIGGGAREACGWETAPVNWKRRWKWEQRWSVEMWCGCGVEMWSHHWLSHWNCVVSVCVRTRPLGRQIGRCTNFFTLAEY